MFYYWLGLVYLGLRQSEMKIVKEGESSNQERSEVRFKEVEESYEEECN